MPHLAPNQYSEEWPQRVRQTVENLKWWHGRGLGGQELTRCKQPCCICETIDRLEGSLTRAVRPSEAFRGEPGPVPANVVPAGDSPALQDRIPIYRGGSVDPIGIDLANIIDCPVCDGEGYYYRPNDNRPGPANLHLVKCDTCHGGGLIDKTTHD